MSPFYDRLRIGSSQSYLEVNKEIQMILKTTGPLSRVIWREQILLVVLLFVFVIFNGRFTLETDNPSRRIFRQLHFPSWYIF